MWFVALLVDMHDWKVEIMHDLYSRDQEKSDKYRDTMTQKLFAAVSATATPQLQ